MYLDDIIARYRALPLTKPSGCAEKEVEALENRLRFRLPEAFREFLLWTGEESGDLFIGSECNFQFLPIARDWAQDILEESGLGRSLPLDAIIVTLSNQRNRELIPLSSTDRARVLKAARDLFNYEVEEDYPVYTEQDLWEFCYIRASEGANPPVYNFSQIEQAPAFRRIYNKYTDLVAANLEAQVERLEKCATYHAADSEIIRPTNFLAEAKAYWQEFKSVELKSCTAQEIFELEKRLGFTFPAAYREFLGWMGHEAGSFWSSREGVQNAFSARLQPYMRTRLLRMLVQDNPGGHEPLPDDAFVFWRANYGITMFMRLSEGDDPPVYIYRPDKLDGDRTQFDLKAPSFSQMLLEEIKDHVNFIAKLYQGEL